MSDKWGCMYTPFHLRLRADSIIHRRI
jgi:hypothetical protein